MFDLMNCIVRLCQAAIIYIAICEVTFESAESCPKWNFKKYLGDDF